MRHEEFTETCVAKCNGAYDNLWSKSLIGYGDESTHFTMELIYNYGVTSYKMGNEFGGVVIKSKDAIKNAKAKNFPSEVQGEYFIVKSPDGYKFFLLNENAAADEDPIKFLIYNVTNLEASLRYWNGLLNMDIMRKDEKSALLSYTDGRFGIQLTQIGEPIDRAEAFGRVVFAVPYDSQPTIDEMIQKNKQTIHTPLATLDTPGKADVRVLIVADPNGHEICFVDDEGFSALSAFDPNSNAEINKLIKKDPFQK